MASEHSTTEPPVLVLSPLLSIHITTLSIILVQTLIACFLRFIRRHASLCPMRPSSIGTEDEIDVSASNLMIYSLRLHGHFSHHRYDLNISSIVRT